MNDRSTDKLVSIFEKYGVANGDAILLSTAIELAQKALGDGVPHEKVIKALEIAGFDLDKETNVQLYITNTARTRRRRRATKKQK